ncbi:MAG: aminomethyl-transferring glycine dehydrogenase subunit GcvPA [Syntrophaceae bacterium]|nr:aminomethyl-transferring glycine dehydrogenase subunit GcvPA [Syntrophaceae bacterium]
MKDFLRYLPHTEEEGLQMLETIGVKRIEDLFEIVPKEQRLSKPLDLPGPLSEPDLIRHLQGLRSPILSSFLGAGAYHHFIPAVISAMTSRSEFYTAYTPYQPEISQGTLQAIFEYQTLMCQLTGMEVSNASMYDGASALAEAVLMARRITKRRKVLLSGAVHPEYRRVVQTYVDPDQGEIALVPYNEDEGRTDEKALLDLLDGEVSAVVVQSPNFFGVVEDLHPIAQKVHEKGGLMIVGFSEAIAYGILKPPGAVGADIVAGEGQSLGIPLSFGGPYLGIFTTLEKFVRMMPGRLVGETLDLNGKRGFVLTLAAREQHIRRERATSNICTNEGLCALMATIFLSCLGREGLREVAVMNLSKAAYAKKVASEISGCRPVFSSPTFNEFVLRMDRDPREVLDRLKEKGILAGLFLGRFYPELDHHLLVTVTEMNTKEEIDRWAETLERALR